MLVLARQVNERIIMPTVKATIEVVAIKPNGARLGIEAPADIPIFREEVLRRGRIAPEVLGQSEPDAEGRLLQVRHVLRNRLHALALGLELIRKQTHDHFSTELESMLHRMEDEVRVLDRQLRTILNDPIEEPSRPGLVQTACADAIPARCLDRLEGGLAL